MAKYIARDLVEMGSTFLFPRYAHGRGAYSLASSLRP